LKKIFFSFAAILFLASPLFAVSPMVRVKDIAHVVEARENQLLGFGLVVGLRNTGDSQQTGFTKQAMTNLLSKLGLIPQLDFKSRNVAAVMVTCTLPPFVKSGQKLDVTVSSMGDATSLQYGTLILTPLEGADSQVYATAQGSVLTGQDQVSPNLQPIHNTSVTAGRIPSGGLVEKEVPVNFAENGYLNIVLDSPDFTTASRMVDSISNAGFGARATDAGTVQVMLLTEEQLASGTPTSQIPLDKVKMIAQIENLTLRPDTVARVVINEREGTVVIGENVKLAEAAIAYGDVTVSIGRLDLYTDGDVGQNANLRTQGTATINRKAAKLARVAPTATLADLVKALNAIKVTPKDLIAILQALKKAGSLKAELEII